MFGSRSPLPPRGLLALIVGVTVVPLATLLWLGWPLLEQEQRQARYFGNRDCI